MYIYIYVYICVFICLYTHTHTHTMCYMLAPTTPLKHKPKAQDTDTRLT